MSWEIPAFAGMTFAPGMGAAALRFVILTAARSGEARGATWVEINLEAGVWTIPAERMKGGEAHRAPLSEAAIAELAALEPIAEGRGDNWLIFPGKRGKHLSDMTLAAVLKRLGVSVVLLAENDRAWFCRPRLSIPDGPPRPPPGDRFFD